MTIINTSPDRIIQLGYEGEDKVTILRFSYSEKWLENGEGIFTVRVLRNGENQAYNAQLIEDDRENCTIDMTLTDVELSIQGYGEMQLVYTGADFVKKSQVYKYYVSRSVDEPVNPPAQDVYTQIIESLSDLQTDVSGITGKIGDLSALTTEAKTDIVSAINEVNERGGGGGSVTVDSELSATSENPVQNKVITGALAGKADKSLVDVLADDVADVKTDTGALKTAIQSKADIQTVSALADAVNGLDTDVQGLQTAVQGKIDDVQVNETSIVSNGVAVFRTADSQTFGLIKLDTSGQYGLTRNDNGLIYIYQATSANIKGGSAIRKPIVPQTQHESAFYGLAKAAGYDEKNSTLPVGTYSEEAKTAIRTMLGLQEMYEWYKNQT